MDKDDDNDDDIEDVDDAVSGADLAGGHVGDWSVGLDGLQLVKAPAED